MMYGDLAAVDTRPAIPSNAFTSSRVKFAAERLAEMARALQPGERIGRKEDVRQKIGVSHGTFNEALRLLQSEGLLTLKSGPQGGLFSAQQSPIAQFGRAVLQLDSESARVSEAVRIRAALEPLIIEDAVGVASASLVDEMHQQLNAMQHAVGAEERGLEFLRANWSLHGAIARVSSNAMLRELYVSLLDFIEGHTISVVMVGEEPMRSFHHDRYLVHRDLVEAIEGDDMAAAIAATHRHNDQLAEVTRLAE